MENTGSFQIEGRQKREGKTLNKEVYLNKGYKINIKKLIWWEVYKMRDVTPKNNMQMLIQSLIYALIIVIIIAFLKVALDAFLSVVVYIIPIALVIFLYMKFGGRE